MELKLCFSLSMISVSSVAKTDYSGTARGRHALAALLAWAAALVVCFAAAGNSTRAVAGDRSDDDEYPRVTLSQSNGRELKLADARGSVATVIVSLATDCPISDEYLPTLNHLAEKYKQSGVTFIGLNPRPDEELPAMDEYAKRTKLTFPFARDSDVRLTRKLNFKVTPEACLFDRAGKLVYRGRIDDRYRAGVAAGGKVTADLANAIDAVVAGKAPAISRTRPVGCPIP